jgi:hypothetical protein
MKQNYLILGTIAMLGMILVSGCVQQPTTEIPGERYCEQDMDCACGVHVNTGECFYGNKNYVNTEQQCPDFCTGIAGDLMIKCVANECQQVQQRLA